MTISFTVSSTIFVNDKVAIVVQGVDVSGNINTNNLNAAGLQYNANTFTFTWTCTNQVEAFKKVEFSFPADPGQSFPIVGSEPSLTLTRGISTIIPPTAIINVQPIGVVFANIFYDIQDTSMYLSVRFQFKLSGVIAAGDTITFKTPPIKRSSSAVLFAYGDRAEDSFKAPFTVQFDIPSRVFTLIATTSTSSREINVYVYDKLLLLDSAVTYQVSDHKIAATIASIGIISQTSIQKITPSTMGAISTSSITVSSCSSNTFCSFQLTLQLSRTLQADESIVLSHPYLRRSVTDPTILNDKLALDANSAASFQAIWRPHDDSRALQLIDNTVNDNAGSGGYVRTSSDIVMHKVNLTLPTVKVNNVPYITSTVPRILSLIVSDGSASIVCGDKLVFILTFDEPVMVIKGDILQIKLNTFEYARYFDGNTTTQLKFIYFANSLQDTSDLSALGPQALQFGGVGSVARNNYPMIAANLTLPPPYGSLLRSAYGSIQISVRNCTYQIKALNVSTLTSSSKIYASGDILDVFVSFEREVDVVGKPTLLLKGDYKNFTAQYIKAASVQWILVSKPGYFSLKHKGYSTPCIFWDDSVALKSALISIPSLAKSLPLSLSKSASSLGYKYRLKFTGLTPELIGFNEYVCYPESLPSITVDSSMLRLVVFRYNVTSGDNATKLDIAAPYRLGMDSGNFIFISSNGPGIKVNPQLPSVGAGSFSKQTNIQIITAPPTVSFVYSDFQKSVAKSGDFVTIYVQFTAPVTVIGYPLLELKFTKYYEGAVAGQTNYVRKVPFLKNDVDKVIFSYQILVGDQNNVLDISSVKSLYLNGSQILLSSLYPNVNANITLPKPGSSNSLSVNAITIKATDPPIILEIYTDHGPGRYNAGEEIYITLHFSSVVWIVADKNVSSTLIPFINLATPTNAKMYYKSGNGTAYIVFKYVITVPDYSEAGLTWDFPVNDWRCNLMRGKFRDYLGNIWQNITLKALDLSKMDGRIVDSNPSKVVLVNSTNPDGVYYPGEVHYFTIISLITSSFLLLRLLI